MRCLVAWACARAVVPPSRVRLVVTPELSEEEKRAGGIRQAVENTEHLKEEKEIV